MKLPWHTHVVRPQPHETALIVVDSPLEGGLMLLGEVYMWSEEHGCFLGETCGLKLKYDAYWWLPETALLETLP